MRLRYTGQCQTCGAHIPAGTTAVYDPGTKTVTREVCVLTLARHASAIGSPRVPEVLEGSMSISEELSG